MIRSKPKKTGRPEFVAARIAQLQRQLDLETNETRKSDLRDEINEWMRSQPKQSSERPRW